MREYRGLTEDGKWLYGWYLEYDKKSYIFKEDDGGFLVGLVKVIPETVGQFTGECEKYSDVKIYAGDIVEFTFEHGFVGALQTKTVRGVVEFRACQYWVGDFPLMRAIDENGEVIGNIRENPELK